MRNLALHSVGLSLRLGALVGVLALIAVSTARAEGSGEFDTRDVSGTHNPHDQAVSTITAMFVDISDSNNEKICWRGTGSLVVRRPDNNAVLATLTSTDAAAGCVNTPDSLNGAYPAAVSSAQAIGTEWDIRVCADTATNAACRTVANNAIEHKGRLWASTWDFSANTSFVVARSVNGSVFAIVPGGAVGRDAVIEMRMEGVSGAFYKLFANSIGPQTSTGVRIGRSAPIAAGGAGTADDNVVVPEFPLYLSPPAKANYNWTNPVVTDVQLTSSCGGNVMVDSSPGTIGFGSNITGQYVVICDVNRDSVFDFASNFDFSSFGNAVPGVNSVSWNGRNNAGTLAAPNDYQCVVRLNVGEFHYIAQDIETSFPGIRMYRVEPDKTTKTAISMFWDDRNAPAEVRLMPNNFASPVSPVPAGLDPQTYATASSPFFYNAGTPTGNARAWGDFNDDGAGPSNTGDGKGNNTFLDTFASAASFTSTALTIRILAAAADPDGDTLSSSVECTGDTDPQDADTDNDGVNDNIDQAPINPLLCRDVDGDTCNDCALTGANQSGGDTSNDGADFDDDEDCDVFDTDDDNDGIADLLDTAPFDGTVCADSDGDSCDDCATGGGADAADDGPDFDQDGECDIGDPDDDNDGVQDAAELSGINLSLDSDDDGIADYRDPDAVACNDVAPPIGACDSLPASVDADGDGMPNQRDLDADGDGLTDAREAGGEDADGDGQPDGCLPVNAVGGCSSGVIGSAVNSDAPADALPDLLDGDSDGDSVGDHIEAFDADGNGTSDNAPSGNDDDADGLDDAFDPDCATLLDCGGVLGRPVLELLTSSQDADGDGIPDWLQICGDAYRTGTESCDDGDDVDGNACSNVCLDGLGQACALGAECASTLCDLALGTCQGCLDDQGSGRDVGCPLAAGTCTTVGASNLCVVCADDQLGAVADDGCSGGTPLCDAAAGGGLGACVQCLGAGDCNDSNQCTADSCTSNSCGSTPLLAGAGCLIGGSDGVCDGLAVPSCLTCIDDKAAGITDSGCSGGTPACDATAGGGEGVCVACTADGDCAGGVCSGSQTCVTCLDTAAGGGTDSGCGGSTPLCDVLAGGGAGACVACFDDQAGDATDVGCGGAAPVCNATTNSCATCLDAVGNDDIGCSGATALCDTAAGGGLGACVQCLGAGDCNDSNQCTADSCTSGSCGSTPLLAGAACINGANAGVCNGLAVPACLTCIDDQAPNTTDSGCSGGTPLCDVSAGGGAGACVECLALSDCAVGEFCSAQHACVPGCGSDPDCTGFPLTPLCKTSVSSCVQCLADDDCLGVQVCLADNTCSAPDRDRDGVSDEADADDDNDGIADAEELGGTDLSVDSDDDGVPDYRDADATSCADSAPEDGDCDVVPAAVDADGDGIANHLDRDSDGDGLSDAREADGVDVEGDGEADGCLPVDSQGVCSGGLVDPPANSDALPAPDFLALDAEGDGIADHVEAFDTDDNGVADLAPAGADSDGDGLDDAFDPDCGDVGDCDGVLGAPVVGALTAAQDADGDGTPDWLELCGDAYVTGDEACDDANDIDGDACNDQCLFGLAQTCASNSECASTLCDDALDTCQSCVDDIAAGTDSGCQGAAPTCATSGDDNACVVCADDHSGLTPDDGCSGGTPRCDAAANAGLGACAQCLASSDCSDGNACTSDSCSAGACGSAPLGAGTACSSGVCNGASTPACVRCIDDAADGASDSGCSNATPACDTSGAVAICTGCLVDGDCTDTPATPVCVTTSHSCVECVTDAQCGDQEQCTASFSCEPVPGEDSDDDGLPDAIDIDDDGDGIRDSDELGNADRPDDLDGDGTPNQLDLDADADGIADATEGHDADLDGEPDRKPAGEDSDGDGLDDAFDPDCNAAAACGGVIGVAAPRPDSDDDGDPNFLDADDDDDQRSTRQERTDAADYDGPDVEPDDIDQDGARNWYDTDSDGDFALDKSENTDGGDANDDDLLDYLDPLFRALDTDDDGVLDVVECPPPANPQSEDCPDSDGDGKPDYDDPDDDNDGVLTVDERDNGDDQDSDGDGKPDHLDTDDDGDGIPTERELGDGEEIGNDVDHDGVPNYLDEDSDGDGVSDKTEGQVDEDGDGVPDYLQKPGKSGFAGGALCSVSDSPRSGNGMNLISLSLLALCAALLKRRTRSPRTGR